MTMPPADHPIWKILQMTLSLVGFLILSHHLQGEHVGLDTDDLVFAILGLKTVTDARHFLPKQE